MSRKYYFKQRPENLLVKKRVHYSGIFLIILGVGTMIFFSLPVFLWKFIHEPSLVSTISPLWAEEQGRRGVVLAANEKSQSILNQDVNEEWFLGYTFRKESDAPKVNSYTLSLPKIGLNNALVSTTDTDLSKHLVQYWGTPIPPEKGNVVIFGHSTLPQLFNPLNYKTIFARIHDVSEGDELIVTVGTVKYTYKVNEIFVTTPDDLSVLMQTHDENILTIITCTPPGTTWKRLILKAKLI